MMMIINIIVAVVVMVIGKKKQNQGEQTNKQQQQQQQRLSLAGFQASEPLLEYVYVFNAATAVICLAASLQPADRSIW